MKVCCIKIAVILLVLFLFGRTSRAQITEEDVFVVQVRVEVKPGKFENFKPEIKLNRPSANPPVTDGHGIVKVYAGNSRTKENCKGQNYDYSTVQINMDDPNTPADEGWKAEVQDSFGKKHQVGHADNKRYWDWYYQAYGKSPEQDHKCDYSQNCFGYAFGVGDWPDDPQTLLALDDQNPNQGCYQNSSIKDAKIVIGHTDQNSPGEHAIKVVGKECPVSGSGGSGGTPGSEATAPKQIYIRSEEQCLESGTYVQPKPPKKTGDCDNPVFLDRYRYEDDKMKILRPEPEFLNGYIWKNYKPN
jgi:hypothetical protein